MSVFKLYASCFLFPFFLLPLQDLVSFSYLARSALLFHIASQDLFCLQYNYFEFEKILIGRGTQKGG